MPSACASGTASRRASSSPILFVVALGLGAGYCAWSGTSATGLFTPGVGWALVAGLVAAAVATPLVRRMPSHPHATGGGLARLMLWEGLVYGIAEAVLLSTLPVLTVWQTCDALGWTEGGWAGVCSGALAIAGSLLVILVHHLGYRQFRTRAARQPPFGALAVWYAGGGVPRERQRVGADPGPTSSFTASC